MHKFHYRPGKAAVMALVLGSLALLSLWTWFGGGDAFWLGIGLVLGLGAGKLMADVASDTPALAYDESGISVRKAWGAQAMVPWRLVQSLSVEVMVLRYLGIIPVARHETLVIKCDGGFFGSRRIRLALKMIELPPGGTDTLMGMLHQAHVGAVGGAGVAMAGAGTHGWGSRSVPTLAPAAHEEAASSFDADAALARYLARKEASAEQVMQTAADMPIAAPARPVFGRKVG